MSERRELARDGLHLLVLCSFALAQPLFDLIARNPEFFATRRSSAFEIVAFAVRLTLVPPALLLVIERTQMLGSGTRVLYLARPRE